MDRKVTKHYTNGEVTIVWKNNLCIHSGVCVRGLPEVFDSRRIPWIIAESSSTEKIIAQVKKCPSGALSFFLNDAGRDKKKISPGEPDINPSSE